MKTKSLLLVLVWLLLAYMAATAPAPAQNTVPGEPTNIEAAPGNSSAAISFNPGASSDTSAPFTFTVKGTGSDGSTPTAAGPGSPIVVPSLKNGVSYTFTVTATDANKISGPVSAASNSVTPGEGLYAAWAGTWNLNFLVAGADAPLWIRCVEQSDANGAFSSSCINSDGSPATLSTGASFLFSYGMVPVITGANPFPDMVCQGSVDNTFNACTATLADGSGSAVLGTGSRQAASSYKTSNLAGKWNLNMLDSGPGDPSWNVAGVTINSSGNFQASAKDSNGKTKSLIGVMSLSSAGVLTCSSGDCMDPTFKGFMDAGKTTIVWMQGGGTSGDDASLAVVTRAASSYSLTDLAGYWGAGKLSTDGTWERMSIQINGDGTFTASEVNSDGSTGGGSGKLAISSKGVVTCASGSCSGVNLTMDAGKTVMAGTATDGSNNYSLTILTKVAEAPGAPTAVTATAGDDRATVSFKAPASDGGSPITGYTVTSSPSGGTDANAGSTSLTHTVTGLRNGTAYTFTVTATNSGGLSTSSKPSNKATPKGAADEGQPTITSLTAGNAQVTVSFSAPKSDGSRITAYTVTSSPAGGIDANAGSALLTHTVNNLTNGTPYRFTVAATNAAGTCASQPSKAIIPTADHGAQAALSSTGPFQSHLNSANAGGTASLKVTIVPPAAVTAGARWNVDGGGWQASGATVGGLAVGSHTVGFNAVTGWNSPTPLTVSVSKGQTKSAKGTYTQQTGFITGITVGPPASSGAKWAVDGGAWHASGVKVGVPVGTHTVSFSPVKNWETPGPQTVTVTNGGNTEVTGTYVQPLFFNLAGNIGTVPQGQPFQYQIPASSYGGGAGKPYSFSLDTGSFPPMQITLCPTSGMLSGTDSSPPGVYTFSLCVTDAAATEKCTGADPSITVTSPNAPGPGKYSAACEAQGTSIQCCADGFCVTVPGLSIDYSYNTTVPSGTSISQLTSKVCPTALSGMSAAGCVSPTCSITAYTLNSFTVSISCTVPPVVAGCSTETVTATCTATLQ